MIRKPDARDFREGAAVNAIRDARSLAVEGARGVGQGARSVAKWWLIGTFGFGFVMSALMAGPVGMAVLPIIGFPWFLWSRGKRQRRNAHDRAMKWGDPGAPAFPHAAPIAPERYELSAGTAGRAAAKIAVPAIIFFPTSSILPVAAPFLLAAIAALALAVLIVAKLFGDRTLLVYDAESVTAKGLLGEATILWADVVDVTVRRAAWWDVRTIFTSGGRRNLLIVGRYNRLGGPDTLHISIELLGLGTTALAQLVSRLLLRRAGAPLPAMAAPELAAAPTPRLVDHASFDPDAIMARYMAEREALVATQRPDLAPVAVTGRPTFGRKRVA